MYLKPYQQRVITEEGELSTKIESLKEFINSIEFSELVGHDQLRLRKQIQYMCEYHLMLLSRIIDF